MDKNKILSIINEENLCCQCPVNNNVTLDNYKKEQCGKTHCKEAFKIVSDELNQFLKQEVE